MRLASESSLRLHPAEGPVALTLRTGNADHLHCLTAAAEAAGLYRGMPLADARAICPSLQTRPASLAAEAAALSALRRLASRYAPLVASDGTDGLIADISGVAHLFGGEADLLADLEARLQRAGLTAACAIAGTRGAAWALAREGGGIIPEAMLAERLAPLPLSALRLEPGPIAALAALGLSRIGDLLSLPRAPLAARFGPGLLLRLDQALGRQPEPVAALPDPPHFGVRMTLPEPIGLEADVMAGLMRLLERLCDSLARHHMGARRLRLELRRVDRGQSQVEIGLARPMREPRRIAALFRKGVEEVDAGFGIDALRLSAVTVEPLAPEQIRPADRTPGAGPGAALRDHDDLADLVSRLGNRIGFDRAFRLRPADSRIPERSYRLIPAADPAPAAAFDRSGPPRPIILFPPEPVSVTESRPGTPPAQFTWRQRRFSTLRATGPERIAPEWWREDDAWRHGLRDYWRIDTREGPRLWAFHTPQMPGWFMQGEFA